MGSDLRSGAVASTDRTQVRHSMASALLAVGEIYELGGTDRMCIDDERPKLLCERANQGTNRSGRGHGLNWSPSPSRTTTLFVEGETYSHWPSLPHGM